MWVVDPIATERCMCGECEFGQGTVGPPVKCPMFRTELPFQLISRDANADLPGGLWDGASAPTAIGDAQTGGIERVPGGRTTCAVARFPGELEFSTATVALVGNAPASS